MFLLVALKEVPFNRDPEGLDVEFSLLGLSTLESNLEKPDLVWGPLLGVCSFVHDWCQDPWLGLAYVHMLAHIFKFCPPVPQGSDQECVKCTS